MGDAYSSLIISREYATISLIVLLELFKIKHNLPEDLAGQAETMYNFLVRQTPLTTEK